MMLLTDGTVIVQGPGTTNTWKKLTPDSSGNYIHGTWSSIASMGTARLYFGSNVLPSGKVFVIGGEYSGTSGTQNFTNTGEIYDPVANTWTPTASFPQSEFGDDPTILLPSGKVLCGYLQNNSTYLYDPATNTWTQTGSKLRSDASDEETWVLLPNGSVLSYDIFSSPETGQGNAQRYVPSSATWVDAGKVPVPLTSAALGYEMGPATLLPNGSVFQVGANNNTVLYNASTNSWTQGPSLPTGMGSDDAPGAMLPNGHFLFLADTSSPNFTPPSKLYDYDYTTNTVSDVTVAGAFTTFVSGPAYVYRMLVLPNGHMLLCSANSGTIWDYAPSGTPSSSWAPTISSITKNVNGSYTLTGTQLTGISQGASYGDDAEMDTNYPIVRLTASNGTIRYARTTNWTPGVATGSLVTSVQFNLPSGTAGGTYQVAVIANGIASATKSFNFSSSPGGITANFSAGTLTLTGTANSESLTVTQQGSTLKIEGANGTTINQTTSVTYPNSGQIVLSVDLGDGDDAISFIGVHVSTATILLGPGADKVAFTLSSVTSLNIDGGPGTDVFLKTSTTIGTYNPSNIP